MRVETDMEFSPFMRSATQTHDSNVRIAKKVPDRRNYFFHRAFFATTKKEYRTL